MAKIATHFGECQGCGRVQKLPGGALSLHGYTVDWGFFQGTCGGAKHLPYELSCEYVKECIVSATASYEASMARVAHLRREITVPIVDCVTIRTGYDRNKCRPITKTLYNVPIYAVEQKGSGDYTWIKVFVDYVEGEETKTYELTGNGGPLNYLHPKTALAGAQALNEASAKMVEAHAQHVLTYIRWQEERVAKWELRPLRPVDSDSDTLAPAAIVHLRAILKKEGFANKSENLRRKDIVYPRAQALIEKGYAVVTETGLNKAGTWIRYEITEAGRAFLNSQEQA
jgi:hypothetical protein